MVKTIVPFSLRDTFCCGQCFRWKEQPDGSFTGVAKGRPMTIRQTGPDTFHLDDDHPMWEDYLDLTTNYNQIKEILLSKDPELERIMESAAGIRILRQDFFEALISFIISQNNHIPRIQSIVASLCQHLGEPLPYQGGMVYAFPTPERIAEADLAFLKAGYRDSYLRDAAEKSALGAIDFAVVQEAPIEEARAELLKLKGVGPKVADCVLLFGAYRTEVFPADVWMKRILAAVYRKRKLTPESINHFAQRKYGKLAGFAQQYLFYYARENGIS